MSIKAFTKAAFAAGAVSTALASQAAPHEDDPSPLKRVSTTTTFSTGCVKLLDDSCKGRGARIEWKNRDGDWRVGLETFRESMGKTVMDEGFDNRFASGGIKMGWDAEIKGVRLTADKSFKLGDTTTIEVGAYVGRATGEAYASGTAGLAIKPGRVTIPGGSIKGLSWPATSYEYAGGSKSYSSDWKEAATSPDAGVRAATGTSLTLTDNMRAGLSTFGEINAVRTAYGAGAAFYYSSSPDTSLGRTPGGECNGRALESSAAFAFSAGICVNKIAVDRIENLKERHANRLAQRVNNHTAALDDHLDQVRDRLPAGVDIPSIRTSFTGKDASRFLGFRQDDYRDLRTAFVISAAVRLPGKTSLSLTHIRDRNDAVTSLSLIRKF